LATLLLIKLHLVAFHSVFPFQRYAANCLWLHSSFFFFFFCCLLADDLYDGKMLAPS
jgi:hypothetical protein